MRQEIQRAPKNGEESRTGRYCEESPAPSRRSAGQVQSDEEGNRIRLTIGGTTAEATLTDNTTSRALASSLPVTVQMSDMLDRELYGALPEPLPSAESDRQTDYRAGQLVYWPPGPALAVYYEHAGPPVPAPGMVVLGTIDSGLDAFTGHDGSSEVTIGRAD
ncbi:cyclophilin-like fold protein [Streptomyces sp. NPDC048438]|uniref:cyclophilin-like fold protein n=1 Tax=Streptomyces sp. NPDC048438 TaxID=3365551 RepID=UPI00371F55B5